MCSINRMGLRTQPWGTLVSMMIVKDVEVPTLMCWGLFMRKFLIHKVGCSVCSLLTYDIMLRLMELNAELMSTNSILTYLFQLRQSVGLWKWRHLWIWRVHKQTDASLGQTEHGQLQYTSLHVHHDHWNLGQRPAIIECDSWGFGQVTKDDCEYCSKLTGTLYQH